ncbi:LytTR family DNA-binding domain-containing protein [Aureisphaera galaxeae]|uniref:LytR/AlgR family response regulator transcription factor n=1 Tax=Aureisphaera galaxeae TaxID=1538023 RepID=UPI00235085E8|nr:LytTR family DNA-binding domain-containing protein [Aureisphaera galaxeae]MDC8004743.1 LytTR family DNA-binding domain-containing protein [Aureisphaera galaxeae]
MDFSDSASLIGSTSNRKEAINTILKQNPSVVFLNVDGVVERPFELADEVARYSDNPPVFIAISKGKEHAYDVIKHGFVDYLLKPLEELDVRKSIMKLEKRATVERAQTICLKSYKDYQYLNTEDILFLKADNNTTDFYMKDGSVIGAFKTLRTFEDILPKNFLRIHKSYIINSNYVSRIQYGKSLCTISENNFRIPFTKTFIDNVEQINNTLYKSSVLSLN